MKRFVEDGELYIRMGNLPPGGRSSMAGPEEEEWLEPGVSVYKAFQSDEFEGVVFLEVGGHLCRDLVEPPLTKLQASLIVHTSTRRPVFVASGEVVGNGGDGEPVLKGPVIKPLPSDIVFVPDLPHPHLDGWVELHNAYRAGGFMGFYRAVQRLEAEGRKPTLEFHHKARAEMLKDTLWLILNQPSKEMIRQAADTVREQAKKPKGAS